MLMSQNKYRNFNSINWNQKLPSVLLTLLVGDQEWHEASCKILLHRLERFLSRLRLASENWTGKKSKHCWL